MGSTLLGCPRYRSNWTGGLIGWPAGQELGNEEIRKLVTRGSREKMGFLQYTECEDSHVPPKAHPKVCIVDETLNNQETRRPNLWT